MRAQGLIIYGYDWEGGGGGCRREEEGEGKDEAARSRKQPYAKSRGGVEKVIKLVTTTNGFDVVAHHAANLDTRGHDLIEFYIQNEPSHSSVTDTGHTH